MRGLKRISDEKFLTIFDVEDVVTLLAHKREEAFEGERAIRLFQFRAWILRPGTNEANAPKWAALITAVKFLDRAEEDYFFDEEDARLRAEHGRGTLVNLNDKPPQTTRRIQTLKKDNNAYREIYDRLIARRGGLLALLDAPSPAVFDRAIRMQLDRMPIISDLIDYRLRYIQHVSGNQKLTADPNGANHNHALFFCWWPTHEVRGRRGRTSPNKSVSIKTMSKWWKKFEGSAVFIYLIQKHGFQQLPMDTDDDSFIDDLLREAKDTGEMLRFLGAYAYLVDTFRKATAS